MKTELKKELDKSLKELSNRVEKFRKENEYKDKGTFDSLEYYTIRDLSKEKFNSLIKTLNKDKNITAIVNEFSKHVIDECNLKFVIDDKSKIYYENCISYFIEHYSLMLQYEYKII